MANQSFNSKDRKPIDYFKEVEAAKKQEKSSADNLVTALRSDMLPASNVSPAQKNIIQRINFKKIGGVLMGGIILVLIWYFLAGSGRSGLENYLASIVKLEPTSTSQITPSPIPATATQPQPSTTYTPDPTSSPTKTQTVKVTPTSTSIPATLTPTTAPSCRDVSTITLADVGQTLCVRGTVIEIIDLPNNFMLVFSYARGAFYWVSYDMTWSKAEVGTCYQIDGKIRQILNSPILVFDYRNIPEVCQ